MELSDLKKKYENFAKKHKLPSFSELNVDFEIDKLDKNTESVLRSIRKLMMEKIVNSMSFLEMLLNPMSSPRMYLPFIRTMGVEDKKKIDDIYSALADLSLFSLNLEIDSEEKAEAELIKNTFEKWNSLKPLFRDIIQGIRAPKNFVVKKERSYFG